MITALLPFLRHHYGDQVLRSFSSEAAARSERAHWNEETKCLETSADRNIDFLLECNDDMDFTTKIPTNTIDILGVPRPDPNQLASQQTADLNQDDDTVSTMRENGTRITPATAALNLAALGTNAPNPSTDSVAGTAATSFSTEAQSTSNASMASFTSRVSIIETRLTQFEIAQTGNHDQHSTRFDLVEGRLEKIMTFMSRLQPSPPVLPTDSARPRQAANNPPDSVGGPSAAGAGL